MNQLSKLQNQISKQIMTPPNIHYNNLVISVPDIGNNSADTIAKKGFYAITGDTGRGIFISRSVESILFYLSIDPQALCFGNFGSDQIILMTMIANNNFLKFSSSDTSGLKLAAQDNSLQNFSFSGLDCSQGTIGCYDGSSTEVLGPNNEIMNGKKVDTSHQIAKYTLRCGIPGQQSQPLSSCSKMFMGKETNNQFINGYGGFFYIKQVDISNGFLPTKVVANEQTTDFMITFYVEDPISKAKILTLTTMINAYVLSYHSTDNVSFIASLVNFSKDSQGIYNPSLLRLRVTNPKDNKKLIIFLDNSLELTSFIDYDKKTYSCEVITKSDTLSHFELTKCLGYNGSTQLNSNYNFNNIIMMDTNVSGVSYLEVLIPVSVSQSNFLNPTFIYVGYGTLIGNFQNGLPSLQIQELISICGITGNYQQLITPILQVQNLENENLNGQQKLYSYPPPSQIIFYEANINQSSKITIEHKMNNLDFNNIKQQNNYFGAGILITSIAQDPFKDQVEFQTKTGTFPNQTGKCFKLSYYMSRKTPDLNSPFGLFKIQKRYTVFCPFDDALSQPQVSSIQIFQSYKSDSSTINFFLAQTTNDNSLLAIAFSEREGRNIAQQNIIFNNLQNVITTSVSVTSPSDNFNINTKFIFNLNFKLDNFNYKPFYNHQLVIEMYLDQDFITSHLIISVDLFFNDSIQVLSFFQMYSNKIYLKSDPKNSEHFGLQITNILINIQLTRQNNNYQPLPTNRIEFDIYYVMEYYPRIEEKLFFNSARYFVDKQFKSEASTSLSVIIDRPVFEKQLRYGYDKMRFSFLLQSTNQNKQSYDTRESIEIYLGFLGEVDQNTRCQAYKDENYSIINHSVKKFKNLIFTFKDSFNYSQKIYIQCYNIKIFNQNQQNTYSVSYYYPFFMSDAISTVQRINEILYADWQLREPINEISINGFGFQYQSCGANTLFINFHQPFNQIPKMIYLEILIYFPLEIDLNEHMHTHNIHSTTLYLPELHALRVKITSLDLINQSLNLQIVPIFLTNQFKNLQNINFYVEYVNFDTKVAFGYSNYMMSNIQFIYSAIEPIIIQQASLKYGLYSSIDTLTVQFKVSKNYSQNDDVKIFIYSRIGSQLNQTPSSNNPQNYGYNSFYVVNYGSNMQNQNNIITISFELFSNKKSEIQDIGYIPIYIYLFNFNKIQECSFLSMKDLVGLNMLSDSSLFDKLYIYFVDNEGDQLYILPIYFNMVDMSQNYYIKELNNNFLNQNIPIIQFQDISLLKSNNDIYGFNYFSMNYQEFKLFLTKDDKDQALDIYFNGIQNSVVKYNQKFTLNKYTYCKVYSEFSSYFTQQNSKLLIRIFFDDYCKYDNMNLLQTIPSFLPTLSSNFATIEGGQSPLQLSSQKIIMFTLNIDPAAPLNIAHQVNFQEISLMQIKVSPIQIWVSSKSNKQVSLSSLTIESTSNKANISLECEQNLLIYFELNLYERKDKLLSFDKLKTQLQDNQVRQQDKFNKENTYSTSYIGSFYCNPQNLNTKQNIYEIKNLRPATQYSIRFVLSDNSNSAVKQFSTKNNANSLLYIETMILLDLKISQQQDQNLIISKFLCYISYYLAIPHYLIRLSLYPTISCSSYLSTYPTDFSLEQVRNFNRIYIQDTHHFCSIFSFSFFQIYFIFQKFKFFNFHQNNYQTYKEIQINLNFNYYFKYNYLISFRILNKDRIKLKDEVCNLLNQDNVYWTDRQDEDDADKTYLYFPKEYKNDTNIYIEIDQNIITNQYFESIQNNKNIQFDKLNTLKTNQYINICENNYKISSIQNYGNMINPSVEIIKNTCHESSRCYLHIEQIKGSSIIYFGLLESELSINQQKELNVNSFRENTHRFLFRYVYPLDNKGIAQFNFTIPNLNSKYYAYYFLTDLTIQDHVYQFSDIYMETIYYQPPYDYKKLIFYVVLPAIGSAIMIGAFFGIKHFRKLRASKKVAPEIQHQETEEDLVEVGIQDIQGNKGQVRIINTDSDFGSPKLLLSSQYSNFNKHLKCQQLVSNLQTVDLTPQKKKISTNLVGRYFEGDMQDIDEVIII